MTEGAFFLSSLCLICNSQLTSKILYKSLQSDTWHVFACVRVMSLAWSVNIIIWLSSEVLVKVRMLTVCCFTGGARHSFPRCRSFLWASALGGMWDFCHTVDAGWNGNTALKDSRGWLCFSVFVQKWQGPSAASVSFLDPSTIWKTFGNTYHGIW